MTSWLVSLKASTKPARYSRRDLIEIKTKGTKNANRQDAYER
ncbi:hypothetical protein PA08_2364 [Cutibacterium modestum P08]|nr:hypothetical protein PA08_2364 [Cutibacterium modestum P08]